jgi:hypothetical protein
MDERLKFIARRLEGEKMAALCREFGICRVTGYKIFNRYKECGLDGLYDRSRAPYRQANKLPYQVERALDLQAQYSPRLHGRQYPMNWQPEIVGSAHERLQISCDLVEICCSSLVIVFKFCCVTIKRIPVKSAFDIAGDIGRSTLRRPC